MLILLDFGYVLKGKNRESTGRRRKARSGLLELGNAEKTDSSAIRVSGPYGGAVCFLLQLEKT